MPPHGFLILDACVLIDFCEADESVLTLVSKYVGTKPAAAEKIAWAIHEANHFVTQAVVERFITKIHQA